MLGEPIGRFRTCEAYPLVVPLRPACANPGCRYVHRMGVLIDEPRRGARVEGELYDVAPAEIARLDDLESYRAESEADSTYLRRLVDVEPVGGGDPVQAHVYFIADAAPWSRLVDRGEAETVASYDLMFATGPLKECCRRDPGHAGPHDVVV